MPRVRPAEPSDAAAVAAILEDARMLQVAAEPEPLVRSRLRRQIEAADAGAHEVYVAERDDAVAAPGAAIGGGPDAVVGFVAVNWTQNLRLGTDGLISDLFVAAGARGEGAGTALLERVARRARQLGCHRLLLTSGREGEAYARGFYPRRGFEEHEELACFVAQVPPEELAGPS